MKNLFYLLLFIISTNITLAQIDPNSLGYYNDALLYSRTFMNGSARIMGLGGANIALGGDISSTSNNPAGLGFFRKSQASISPAMLFNSSQASYLGESLADNKATPNIANAGVVFSLAKPDYEKKEWKGGSIAVSFSRINNFQSRFNYEGFNRQNSMADFFVEQTNGINYQDLNVPTDDIRNLSELAYMTFMIENFADAENEYFTYARDENNELSGTFQTETVTNTGSQNQWNIAYGGNYDDKLYFGASLGVGTINYKTRREYTEIIEGSGELKSFDFTDELQVKGTSINASLGLIYRVHDVVRLGISVQTPSWFFMRENYGTSLAGQFEGLILDENEEVRVTNESTVLGTYNYRLTTPFRLSAGLSVFAGKYGFISADAEYIAYNTAQLNAEDFSFQSDNKTIKNLYQPTLNFRLGAEFRYQMLRLRGGVALYQDPYTNIDDTDRSIMYFTGGLGVHAGKFFVDLAVVYHQRDEVFVPYTLQDFSHSSVNLQQNFTNAILTAGFSF